MAKSFQNATRVFQTLILYANGERRMVYGEWDRTLFCFFIQRNYFIQFRYSLMFSYSFGSFFTSRPLFFSFRNYFYDLFLSVQVLRSEIFNSNGSSFFSFSFSRNFIILYGKACVCVKRALRCYSLICSFTFVHSGISSLLRLNTHIKSTTFNMCNNHNNE